VKLFNTTNIPLLNKALDAYALRQKVSASNISNITSVGYKSQSVSFEEHLAAAKDGSVITGARTNEHHLPIGFGTASELRGPEVYETRDDKPVGYNEMASGFNDVDIDQEMTNLAKNQIQFRFGSRFIGETFKGIQKAIRGSLS
jgi:flagellar basal-body rod protein FlgB